MASIFRRRGIYQIKFRRGGRWVYRSLRTRNRRQALREKVAVEAWLLGEGKGVRVDGVGSDGDPGFEGLVKLYKDWAAVHVRPNTSVFVLQAVRGFREHHSGLRPAEVRIQDVEDWMASLVARGRKAITVNGRLRGLRTFYNRARAQGWYAGENPALGVKTLAVPKALPLWLDQAQIRGVLAAAAEHGTDAWRVFHLGIYAGLRKREIVEARWEWIGFDASTIMVRGSDVFVVKNHQDRSIPLHAALRTALEDRREAEGYLVAPKSTHGRYQYRYDFHKLFGAVTVAAGVPWCTAHTLRHTFASQLAMAGVSLYKVQRWLGHASFKTTQIYAHLAPADDEINSF